MAYEGELARTHRWVEYGEISETVDKPIAILGVAIGGKFVGVAEQPAQIGARIRRRGVRQGGFGERVLHHFKRHVRGRVIGAGGHSVGRFFADLGCGDKVFEQVAEHFGVNRLFAGVWGVFGRSPVVLVEDGEQAGRIRIGAEIVFVGEVEQVVVLVAREQGAVEEARIGERLLDARVGVRYAVVGRLVEPFVKQECENGVVVSAGRFALCESFVEGFGRQFAVFVEYPHENDANEMAQYGFAVGVALVGAAGCLALLAQRPAVGELLKELFADGLGGYGVRQRIGSDGGGLVELIVDALYGSQRFGGGHMRVELGGHASMPLVVNCDAGGGGFAGFAGLDHQRHGHFERHDFGESFGG